MTFFSQQGSSAAPASQNLTITTSGAPKTLTISTSSSAVAAAPATGTTPLNVSISVDPTELQPSTTPQSFTMTITSPDGSTATYSVTVDEIAEGAPNVGAVTNAASEVVGAVSPGEVISIFGTNIGPSTPQVYTLTAAGTVPMTLAGTTVSFDAGSDGTFLAPLLFVSSGQNNVIVPYGIGTGLATVDMTVTTSGGTSAKYAVRVKPATSAAGVASPQFDLGVIPTNPAIFSLTQTGNSQGAILNQDFSVNSVSNPAAAGSIIQIFATGEGLLSPQPASGSLTPSSGTSFPKPVGAVAVTIGGQPAQLFYAGEAPGQVSGVLQVNAEIPKDIGSGPQVVVLTVGTVSNAQQAITVAVK